MAVKSFKTREVLRSAAFAGYELSINDVIDLVCNEQQIHVHAYRDALQASPHFPAVSQAAMEYVSNEWGPKSHAFDIKRFVKAKLGV